MQNRDHGPNRGPSVRGRLKAKAIEEHLKHDFKYDTNSPSGGKPQPVDHFLFESKKGHCEFFSTGMAIMLREIGIDPTSGNDPHASQILAGLRIVREDVNDAVLRADDEREGDARRPRRPRPCPRQRRAAR